MEAQQKTTACRRCQSDTEHPRRELCQRCYAKYDRAIKLSRIVGPEISWDSLQAAELCGPSRTNVYEKTVNVLASLRVDIAEAKKGPRGRKTAARSSRKAT